MNEAYKKQVMLVLDVLPEVAKETCFAMHGGTAINLFVRNMPRLSVDIDLTYVEISERKETLDAINAALGRIKESIEKLRPLIRIEHKENICKLQLIETVRASLDENDKAFLLSLNRLAPDWSIYDYQDFPSVKWKLLNLEKFKRDKLDVYKQQLTELEDILE